MENPHFSSLCRLLDERCANELEFDVAIEAVQRWAIANPSPSSAPFNPDESLGAGADAGAVASDKTPPHTSSSRSAEIRSPTSENGVSPLNLVLPFPQSTYVSSESADKEPKPIPHLSPLERAIETRNLSAVRALIRGGSAVDFVGGFSCTALCKTCYSYHQEISIIRTLLEAGANPDATTNNDTNSASCLIISVVKGNLEGVRALLEYGADVTYEWRSSNALSMALDFKKLEIAELFENFEFRKAQENRWKRYQQRKQREAEKLLEDQARAQGANLTPDTQDSAAALDAPMVQKKVAVALPQRQRRDSMDMEEGENTLEAVARNMTSMEWLISPSDLEIVSPLGAGAHGEVFRGRLISTGDNVAVKRIQCKDEKARRTFIQEVSLLARFRHENILMFKGAVLPSWGKESTALSVDPDICSILSELCTETLFDRMNRDGPLSWKLRLRWAHDIAKAMTYLHTRNPPVVHRDLKSNNILLDDNDTVKLCDFGIARLLPHTFIATKNISGSPSWMAPEVLRGDDFDVRADVYAFGVIMWELITRSLPWPDKNMAQLVGLVGFSGARLEIPVNTDAPPALVALTKRCFENADSRPTFREIRDVLDGLLRPAVD